MRTHEGIIFHSDTSRPLPRKIRGPLIDIPIHRAGRSIRSSWRSVGVAHVPVPDWTGRARLGSSMICTFVQEDTPSRPCPCCSPTSGPTIRSRPSSPRSSERSLHKGVLRAPSISTPRSAACHEWTPCKGRSWRRRTCDDSNFACVTSAQHERPSPPGRGVNAVAVVMTSKRPACEHARRRRCASGVKKRSSRDRASPAVWMRGP